MKNTSSGQKNILWTPGRGGGGGVSWDIFLAKQMSLNHNHLNHILAWIVQNISRGSLQIWSIKPYPYSL